MKNEPKKFPVLLVLAGLILVTIIATFIVMELDLSGKSKVGLIITGSAQDDGWNGMHYEGVEKACKKLGTKLIVKENIPEGTGECAEAVHELVKKGAEMIILSSYGYPEEVKGIVGEYPDVAFYGISAEYYADNMTSYFGRMYQARYLTGIIAGMETETNEIGYVIAMKNSEVNRGINAFTLGVRSVNPEAVVNVIETGAWEDGEKETEAANKLINDMNVDVITYHQNQNYVALAAEEAGIYSIGYHEASEGLSEKHLTSAIWNWESLYYEIIREFTQGKPNCVQRHWFGMGTGVVGLSEISPLVKDETIHALEAAKSRIYAGMEIFSGTIYDNEGNLRCGEDEAISDTILLESLDWYVEGVEIYE